MFVGAVVVHDQVQFQIRLVFAIQPAQEFDELLVAVMRITLAAYLTAGCAAGGMPVRIASAIIDCRRSSAISKAYLEIEVAVDEENVTAPGAEKDGSRVSTRTVRFSGAAGIDRSSAACA
jgi:hypothetical protein